MNVLPLCISLVLINFDSLPNSFGRFILVEVDQKEVTRAKLGAGRINKNKVYNFSEICDHLQFFIRCSYSFKLDLREVEECLKEEGIPDVCLSVFKTGNSNERCNKWLDTNPGLVKMTDVRLKKCVSQSTTEV